MNIQFRKIHLPSLPKINAHALIELAENNGNSALKSPALPDGVAKSPIVSRSNLDEIIQDIVNSNTQNITILEWVHCLFHKEKWDSENIDRSELTSQAIWKAAKQNSWLKQKLFWNLVLHLELNNVLAPSLVSSYDVFVPQDSLDRGKLAIIQALTTENSLNDFTELCWSELLTPSQLLIEYQLPSKISFAQAAYDYVVRLFSTSDCINDRQIEWLLKCLEQMSSQQQIRAVEHLLTQVDRHIGAEHPELIDWLRQHYGFAVANSRWNELSPEAKAAMRKWLGAVSYQDFQRLVRLILERVHLAEREPRRLQSRSGFWSNYSDRFERIRILLPQSSVNILGNHLNNQDISILLEDGSDLTEVCIFDFANWFVVEFFRGDGSETSLIKKDVESEQKLFHSQLSIKSIRCLERDIHDHEFCWQYFCERLLKSKGIVPNENIQCFKGLAERHGRYNRLTGLPQPSPSDLQRRTYRVEGWKQRMARLEREAETYCNRN
jgi:hypothetical protein